MYHLPLALTANRFERRTSSHYPGARRSLRSVVVPRPGSVGGINRHLRCRHGTQRTGMSPRGQGYRSVLRLLASLLWLPNGNSPAMLSNKLPLRQVCAQASACAAFLIGAHPRRLLALHVRFRATLARWTGGSSSALCTSSTLRPLTARALSTVPYRGRPSGACVG